MTDEEKLAWNVDSESRMRTYLRSLRWEEKIASIERMNEAGRMARAGMRAALERERREREGVSLPACDVEPLA